MKGKIALAVVAVFLIFAAWAASHSSTGSATPGHHATSTDISEPPAPGGGTTEPPVSAPSEVTGPGRVGPAGTTTSAHTATSSTSEPAVPRSQVDQAEALSQATTFAQAYARPASAGPEFYAWWATVEPTVAPSALKTLHINPLKSPYKRVTGPGRITKSMPNHGRAAGTTDYEVELPTDTGKLRVRMTPTQADRMLVMSAHLTPTRTTTPSSTHRAHGKR